MAMPTEEFYQSLLTTLDDLRGESAPEQSSFFNRPMSDHELVEYVLGVPSAVKKRFAGVKGLLVEACRDLLPSSVYERPKAGFVLPMKVWMGGPLASFVDQGVGEATSRQLLPETFVSEVKTRFCQDSLHWTRLWSIAVLGHYAKRHGLFRDIITSPVRELSSR